MSKNNGRIPRDIKMQPVDVKSAGADVYHSEAAVTHANGVVKHAMAKIKINPNNLRQTLWFKIGTQMLNIDVNGRRICRQCGGICTVISNPRFSSSDGEPKRWQKIKCNDCGFNDEVRYSTACPYDLLTPSAKNHPMSEVLTDIACIADKFPALTNEQQQSVVAELRSTLNALVERA